MTDLVARTLAAAAERMRTGQRAELRARGVVATPAELARHAVARVDTLLRSELGLADGLASERVVVVDPAVGTGVWLAALLEHTRARGARCALFGFDSDADALATVEAVLRAEVQAQGATLTLQRANTLMLERGFPARDVVRVVLGNPPWAARSLSRGLALSDAWLADFRVDHLGAPLGERRMGVLSDDYVRFVRWALEQARAGTSGSLVCLATNASYLDGPVHRGMRAALAREFDHLELLDLGGNGLLSRDAGPDENLFGVRVGAALIWALRRPEPRGERAPTVSFAVLRGSRRQKLESLASATPAPVQLEGPWFRFRPSARSTVVGFSIADAFPFHREGVQTNRDAVATDTSRERLRQRLEDLVHGRAQLVGSRHFDPTVARRALAAALERNRAPLQRLAYRPLETRFYVDVVPLCHRPRHDLARAVAHSPLCLLAVRKERGHAPFNLFAAAKYVPDACFLSTRSSCRTRAFPSHAPDGTPNVARDVQARIEDTIGCAISSEQLIAYVLSILGAPRFRRAHADALRQDYARVPWPRDGLHFARAVEVGQAFAHALTVDGAEPAAADCTDTFVRLNYVPDAAAVCADGAQILGDVAPEWWNCEVGHHRLIRRANVTKSELAYAVTSAAQWCRAERLADALWDETDAALTERTPDRHTSP